MRPFHISTFVGDGHIVDLGDRALEVLLTPGHTPDSLCLLDRKNRLLFTGDTFYPGPIYLYVQETDVDAYARSVDRLAALIPQLDLLLTAHNFPVSRPEVLARLAEALRRVRSGTAAFSVRDGLREYTFEGFSLLVASR
jgi:glyoxylase-like metal-dependent hydrolase (beta-lactamase superfamily II)